MLKFYIIRPYTSLDPIQEISSVYSGISEASLEVALNSAYKLEFKIQPDNELYPYFKQENIGLRIVSDDFDVAFIKERQPTKQLSQGQIQLGFFSHIWRLKYSEPLQAGKTYNGGAAEFLSGIDPMFEWVLIGENRQVEYQTPTNDNWEILNDFCDQFSYNFRDNGVVNGKTQIVIGNMKQIELAPRYKEFVADIPPSTIPINGVKPSNPRVDYSGEVITHLLVIGDTGQGDAKNSRVTLNNTQENFYNPEFPVIQKNGVFYIINGGVDTTIEKYATNTFTLSDNTQGSASQDIDVNTAKKTIYNKGVSYLRSKSFIVTPRFEVDVPLTYAGNKVRLRYIELQTMPDGRVVETFNFDEYDFLRSIKYDNLEQYL